jgi:hypothetical protein
MCAIEDLINAERYSTGVFAADRYGIDLFWNCMRVEREFAGAMCGYTGGIWKAKRVPGRNQHRAIYFRLRHTLPIDHSTRQLPFAG